MRLHKACAKASAEQLDLAGEGDDSASRGRESLLEVRRFTSNSRDRQDGLIKGRTEPHV